MQKYEKIAGKAKKVGKSLDSSKKVRTFAPANKEHGSVAQLNRASDYGSEGCGFESRRNHFFSFAVVQWNVGSVAQLNRASDYGSEGCGFESRRNH